MSSLSKYRRVIRSWRIVQFEIVSFSLIVLGLWLTWKISRRPNVPDWAVYVIVVWGIVLLLQLWRIISLIKKIRKN